MKKQTNTKTQKEISKPKYPYNSELLNSIIGKEIYKVLMNELEGQYWLGDVATAVMKAISSHAEQVEMNGYKNGFEDCRKAIIEGKHNHCCFKKEVQALSSTEQGECECEEMKYHSHKYCLETCCQEQRFLGNIGMLRQWLNEDRIKDADRFVTNEEIEYWLELRNKLKGETDE